MIIVGIETSCDETAISVVEAEGGLESLSFKLLGSSVHSQIDLHKEYGGVVPRLAKREHIKNLPIVLEEALRKSGVNLEDVDLLAVTVGPGLEPALWAGIKFAEELAHKHSIPVVPTNHMVGHIASVLFSADSMSKPLFFPALALLISGGHTELVLLNSWVDKKKIGQTQDDAVGEAFDKVARMLGLPYPGGPEISKLAGEARTENLQLETKLPRPMIHSKDLNFSFSGLKTAVLYYIKTLKELDIQKKKEIAREFEDAVIETLLSKTKKAIEQYSPQTLIIGGGVIANKTLRERFLNLHSSYPTLNILIPEKTLTTDNATMIAAAGFIQYLDKGVDNNIKLEADGNLRFE